jgi:hypothetical protein
MVKPASWVIAAGLALSLSVAAAQAPPEQATSTIGYPTVAAALQDLHSRPDVVFSAPNGWTVANDKPSTTIWSFVPATDPAYPAVVKRRLVRDGDAFDIKMDVLCGGPKAACEHLVSQFEALNAEMKANILQRAGPPPARPPAP